MTAGDFVFTSLQHLPPSWRFYVRKNKGWEGLTSQQILEMFQRAMGALIHAGVKQGQVVAQVGPNRPEMFALDLAVMAIGAIGVVYPDSVTHSQLTDLLEHTQPCLLFVHGDSHMERVPSHSPPVISWESTRGTPWQEWLATAQHLDEGELQNRQRAVKPEDPAFILYTSGTEGHPKAVVHSHHNLLRLAHQMRDEYGLRPGEVVLAFVPLCHLPARLGFLLAISEPYEPWMSPDLSTVASDMAEVKPTFLPGVPRLFEKVQAKVEQVMDTRGGAVVRWALAAGRVWWVEKRRTPWTRLQHNVADRLVLSKIRGPLGGRVERALCGGAAVDPRVLEFFAALGIGVRVTYGMSEVGVISIQSGDAPDFETTGWPARGVEIEFATDGEVLVKTPCCLVGYWQPGGEIRPAVDSRGFFHTGDVGQFDPDGRLRILDRKGDLVRTSGGKSIAPGVVESALCHSRFIAVAVLAGEGRPYPVVLLQLEEEQVTAWAQAHHLPMVEFAEWNRWPALRNLLESELTRLTRHLPHFEHPKQFYVLSRTLDIGLGEMTPTGKVRRRVVRNHFQMEIDSLYQHS